MADKLASCLKDIGVLSPPPKRHKKTPKPVAVQRFRGGTP